MWARWRPLISHLDPVRCEHKTEKGWPDVNYIEGWVENKQIARWPAGEQVIVRVDHFTHQQRTWLTKRARAGGKVSVMLHIAATDDWLWIPGRAAALFLGRVPRIELISRSRHFVGLPSREEICSLL